MQVTMRSIAIPPVLLFAATVIEAFCPIHAPNCFGWRQHGSVSQVSKSLLFASSNHGKDVNRNSSNNDNDSFLARFRSMLESSWNVETMGPVPTTAGAAADGAAAAILAALQDLSSSPSSTSSTTKPVFMVNILLPQYDASFHTKGNGESRGRHLYDEVLAVEFAIELEQRLELGKACIVVRDDKTVRTVDRIFQARDKAQLERMAAMDRQEEQNQPGDKDMDDEDDDDDAMEYYDDFGDYVGDRINSTITTTLDADDISADRVKDFRQQLMSSWDTMPDAKKENIMLPPPADSVSSSSFNDSSRSNPVSDSSASISPTASAASSSSSTAGYRLTSMLGNLTSTSSSSSTSSYLTPDRMDQVIKAVSAHAQPKDDEDVLIILSACSNDEMIGVRALVNKYQQQQQKTILLVNCQLDPLPRELIHAEMVYSILPLIARSSQSTSAEQLPQAEPKVVLMRRYPADWQLYIDDGGYSDSRSSTGFQLAASIPVSQVDRRRGPTMEWIAAAVKRHLQSKQL